MNLITLSPTESLSAASAREAPPTHIWPSCTTGELVHLADENIREAQSIAGKEYQELNNFISQFQVWKRKLNSEEHRFFWIKVINQTKSLIERIKDHELRGYDTVFEEQPVPQNPLTAHHKSWADYTSSSEEEDEIAYLYKHVQVSSLPNGIIIPADLKTVWPKGYRVFEEASRALGFDLIEDSLTLARAGFKGKDSLSEDETTAREAFSRLHVDDQRAINILKSLVMFMKLEPDRTLATDPKFALSASYVLHFLLKTGNSEDDLKLSRSLKHQDGGKSLIMDKISPLFLTDRTIVQTLMTSVEKICRSLARNTRANKKVFTDEMKNLIVDMCYTSPEGMLEKYYVRERREVTTWVNELDRNGKTKSVKKTKLVNGFRAPGLCLSEELIKPDEVIRLKTFEHRFSMSKLAKKTKEAFLETGGKPEDITVRIEELVRDGYASTSSLSSVIRQRKKAVRAEALKAAQTGKLTQSQWIVASEYVLTRSPSMSEQVFEEIERFLQKWEAGG